MAVWKLAFFIIIIFAAIHIADSALTKPQRQTILNVINNLRRRVAIGDFSEFPPSANMRVLEWDDRLEAQSRLQNGITRCGPEQMLSLSRTVPFKPYPLVGYVVVLSVGETVNMSTLLNKWLIERKQYRFNLTWDCIDLSCKNFLQLIWGETAFVGCSHNEKCDNGRLLCYFAEGAPRRLQALPYLEGAPCSRCSASLSYCMAKSLCATRRACSETQSQCECDVDQNMCAHGDYDPDTCTCTCHDEWSGARCNAPCSDIRPDCSAFKDQGACRWDALEWRHMERECRETCGYCDGSVREDDFHTNLEQVLPNAGFPLFRVRDSMSATRAPPLAMNRVFRPYKMTKYPFRTTSAAPMFHMPTTRTLSDDGVDIGLRTDIPWTKHFLQIDGYDQFPGNCRGGLMAEQSCVYCTLHDCAGACTRLKSCVGFSYILDENRCLLKNEKCYSPDLSDRVHYYDKSVASAPIKVSHDDSAAASANAKLVEEEKPERAPEYNPESYDSKIFPAIPGYRLLAGNCPGAVVPDGGCANCTVDYCSLLCSATARCAGFSFVSQTRLCYLKWQSCEKPFPNEFTKFYQKLPGQQSFKLIEGYTLLTGYCDPVANATTHCQPCAIDECKERCNGRADCAGFTYYINNEKCDLLSSTCREQITNDQQRVYVKVGPGGSTYPPAQPTTLPTTTQPTTANPTTASTTTSTTTTTRPTTTTTVATTTAGTTGVPTTAMWFKPLAGYKQLPGNCFGSALDEQGCNNCPIEECALRCSLLAGCSGFTYVLSSRQCLPKAEACSSPPPADDVKFYVKESVITTTVVPTTPPSTLPTWAPDPDTTTTQAPTTPSTTRQTTRQTTTELTTETTTPPATFSVFERSSTLGPLYPYIEYKESQNSTIWLEGESRDVPLSKATTSRPTTSFRPPPKTKQLVNEKGRMESIEPHIVVLHNNMTSTTRAPALRQSASHENLWRPGPKATGFAGRSAPYRQSTVLLPTNRPTKPPMPWLGYSGPLSNPRRELTGPREEDIRNLAVVRTHNRHDFTRQPGSLEVSNKAPMVHDAFWRSTMGLSAIPRSRDRYEESRRRKTLRQSNDTAFPPKVPGYHLLPGNCYGNILSEGGCVDCSALECARRCDSLPGCGGFTYIPYQLRRCIPKSGTCSNPTVNEQIRFYERDSLVPTLSPIVRSRGRNMPRAMMAPQTLKPSAIFFDYHPAERARTSLFMGRSSRRGTMRSLFGRHNSGRSMEQHSMERSRSQEQELEMYSSSAVTTTASPTPPPPISDFAPPGLLDCRYSSVQLAQLSCQACSVDDCAANCRSSPACVGFTFDVPKKTCLPVSTICFTPSPDANIVFYSRLGVSTTTAAATTNQPTGTTWFPTPRNFQELPGQNCWSGTIPQGECMPCTSDQCADTCQQMPTCVGFTYILAQQHCLPKSQACNLDSSNDVNLRFYQRLDGPPIVTSTPSTTTQPTSTASQMTTTPTIAPTTPNGPYNPQPQSDAILTTRQICYNTVAQLSCGGPFGGGSNDVIRIIQAHFGRISYPNEMTCGQQNPVDDGAVEAECGFFDVKPFVSALCNDKANCSVFASDNILGNCQKLNLACPLRSLYLEVTFMCISSIDHCSVISSEIPAGITFAASSSARMGAPHKPRPTCPGTYGASCDPSYALFTSSAMQAWCPSECDKNDGFIQLDLGAPYQISALILQGRRRWDHWISRYYITYSANGNSWQQLDSQGTDPLMLDGNWDARSVVIRRFPSPSPLAAVRYLRLHIANFIGFPAVHVDVVRCPEVVGCTPLTVAHSNATGVFAVYGQSVIVQCDRRFVTPVSRLSLFSAACLPTGEWSRTEQCLLATNCGEFPRVDNALHDGQSAEIGRRLMFTCNPGYRLVGNPMVTCQPSGLWSDLPSCVPTNAIV